METDDNGLTTVRSHVQKAYVYRAMVFLVSVQNRSN